MSATRYVIMANGKGLRWGNHLGIPKHLIEVDGESLLDRIVRQVLEREPNSEVIISSKDPRLESAGARRHTPEKDEFEIDRFVPELITDNVCFLYGDTYYSDSAMDHIVQAPVGRLLFFGTHKAIGAVHISDKSKAFDLLRRLRALACASPQLGYRGWQLYQMYCNLPLSFGEQDRVIDSGCFVLLDSQHLLDFNCPGDLHTASFPVGLNTDSNSQLVVAGSDQEATPIRKGE